jgi:hypothetical protein
MTAELIPMSPRERALAKWLAGTPLTAEEQEAIGPEPPHIMARPPTPIHRGWDRPIPLEDARALPPFPVESLPAPLASFVSCVAEATQTPVDLAGVMVLAALAAAAGGRAVVQARAGWSEPTNLFVVAAMDPGNRKSAVVERVTRPLRVAERDAVARRASEVKEAIADQSIAKMKAKELERKAARAAANGDENADELAQHARDASGMADQIAVPATPRLLADDCTPEALASLMAEQGGRLAVISAEGGIFDIIAGKYSKMPSFDVFLKGHAGDEIRVDRVGRKPEHIERPALTLGLAVQPAVLRTIVDREGFRGRGLLARFMFVQPTSFVGKRKVGAAPVPEAVDDNYDRHMRALVNSLAGWTDPCRLVFSGAANEALLDYERDLEPKLDRLGELGHIADWGSKLAGAVVRIAGLLHLATHLQTGYRQPIDRGTFAAAAAIGDYFMAHAIAVQAYMGADPQLDDAKVILNWITGRKTFTKRDIHRAHKRRFPKSKDIDGPLALLEDRGWIRRKEPQGVGPSGGRPALPTFEVHPAHAETHP